MTSNGFSKPDKKTESPVERASEMQSENILKQASCMRMLKLTMNISMKFFIIKTFKWN